MGTVRVLLRGGPEDGHEVSVPTNAAGAPVPRFTVPARRPDNGPLRTGQVPPQLVYERDDKAADGTWRFRYVGVESG